MELMRACPVNFSPLLGLYEDLGQKVTKLLGVQSGRKPTIEFADGGEAHKLWVANEPEFVQRVSHFLASKPIYIADGHHRYETALAYRDERRQQSKNVKGNEAYNFIMITVVSFSDPGLVVLPVHRLIGNLSGDSVGKVRGILEAHFELIPSVLVDGVIPETTGATARVLGLEPGKIIALKLRQSSALKELMPQDHSHAYNRLDISIVQHLIIEKLAAMDKHVSVAYTPNAPEALRLVENGDYKLAFLLNNIPVSTIKSIADSNDKMPGKSTYFYPKLPTGLVLNRLEGTL